MRLVRTVAGTAVVALLASACSTPSRSYLRQDAPPAELVLRPGRHGLQVDQDRQPLAHLSDLDPIVEAVGCVPEADAFASRAENWMLAANILRWTSFVATGVAAALIIGGGVRNDREMYTAGLIVLPVSAIVYWLRDLPLPFARVNTIDAINAYNDQYPSHPGCRGAVAPIAPADQEPGSKPR